MLLNPDGEPTYRALVGASYQTLASTVAGVESLLAAQTAPNGTSLDTVTNGADWSGVCDEILHLLFATLEAEVEVVAKLAGGKIIDILVDATIGKLPLVGWLLSPSVACAIKQKYQIPC